jgi:hypothetical protein
MIEVTSNGLKLGQAVVRALLAFASSREEEYGKKNTHLCGIAIEGEGICASDGHTAVRFLVPQEDQQLWLVGQDKRYFPRELVEARLAAAKNVSPCIELGWHEIEGAQFPELSEVEPERREVQEGGGVLLDPVYLERLIAVGRACRRPREQGEAQVPAIPGALIVGFKGEMDPVRFEIGTQDTRCAHVAYVTIMPMAQAKASPAAVARAKAATTGAKERKTARRQRARSEASKARRA